MLRSTPTQPAADWHRSVRLAHLELFFLGAPRVVLEGAPVTFDTRKAIALLAYLAVTGQPQQRDALATLLWPDADQSHARGALRRTLAKVPNPN